MSKFQKGHNKAAKLTAANVQDIRAIYAAGDATQGELSRDYKVSVVQIGRIVRGESWQSLPALPPSHREMEVSAQRILQAQAEIVKEQEGDGSGLARLQGEAGELRKADRLLDELEGETAEKYPWLKK